MSYVDVKAYYKEFERTHFEKEEVIEELRVLCEDGKITQEQVDALEAQFKEEDKTYQLLSHVMYLWNLPSRLPRKRKILQKDLKLKEHFKKAKVDQETVAFENENVLVNFINRVNEIKESV